jgi:hypothetical protein
VSSVPHALKSIIPSDPFNLSKTQPTQDLRLPCPLNVALQPAYPCLMIFEGRICSNYDPLIRILTFLFLIKTWRPLAGLLRNICKFPLLATACHSHLKCNKSSLLNCPCHHFADQAFIEARGSVLILNK